MGHELRITRKEQWHADGPEIDRVLWRQIVAEDPELEPDADDGARWFNPVDPASGDLALHWDTHGNIVAMDPDRGARAKMYHLAQMLGGKVQGEEGEVYDSLGNAMAEPPASSRGGLFFFLFVAIVLAFMLFMFITGQRVPH